MILGGGCRVDADDFVVRAHVVLLSVGLSIRVLFANGSVCYGVQQPDAMV